MKLKNKKTGEIATLTLSTNGEDMIIMGNDELKDYEDYEEDKRYWYIDTDGEIMSKEMAWFDQSQDDIGNRFETKEEAEKAVEKLKAWKRLKDEGFRFTDYDYTVYKGIGCGQIFYKENSGNINKIKEDLYLLFGDKDEQKRETYNL